jgi:hypothetical protein
MLEYCNSFSIVVLMRKIVNSQSLSLTAPEMARESTEAWGSTRETSREQQNGVNNEVYILDKNKNQSTDANILILFWPLTQSGQTICFWCFE